MRQSAAKTVTIEHGPEGTTVRLEDVTPLEIVALVVILVAGVLVVWRTRRR